MHAIDLQAIQQRYEIIDRGTWLGPVLVDDRLPPAPTVECDEAIPGGCEHRDLVLPAPTVRRVGMQEHHRDPGAAAVAVEKAHAGNVDECVVDSTAGRLCSRPF
jgi:hypothetical protein